MKPASRTILIAAGALLLAGPAVANDGDKPNAEGNPPEVTAEQRAQAMQERREAVRKLPPEQRAAVREAHRNAMTPEERAEHRAQMQNRPQGERQHKRCRGQRDDG
jgi:DNA-directed RNA polymerase specialized sigma24 family protein